MDTRDFDAYIILLPRLIRCGKLANQRTVQATISFQTMVLNALVHQSKDSFTGVIDPLHSSIKHLRRLGTLIADAHRQVENADDPFVYAVIPDIYRVGRKLAADNKVNDTAWKWVVHKLYGGGLPLALLMLTNEVAGLYRSTRELVSDLNKLHSALRRSTLAAVLARNTDCNPLGTFARLETLWKRYESRFNALTLASMEAYYTLHNAPSLV